MYYEDSRVERISHRENELLLFKDLQEELCGYLYIPHEVPPIFSNPNERDSWIVQRKLREVQRLKLCFRIQRLRRLGSNFIVDAYQKNTQARLNVAYINLGRDPLNLSNLTPTDKSRVELFRQNSKNLFVTFSAFTKKSSKTRQHLHRHYMQHIA